MKSRQIVAAEELYGIEEWGAGYFSINSLGQVVCTPLGPGRGSIPLPEVIAQAQKNHGVRTPMLLRFPQIIKKQMQNMHRAFRDAISEFQYPAQHLGVFPFKVNQRRECIDGIVACGKEMDWGLEVGSKTEFMAALSYPLTPKSLLICNGFKDPEFIQMAFTAAKLDRNIVLVVEGPDELQCIIQELAKAKGCPTPSIGLRVRLYSRGSGKWENSSGETSKFGLTTSELLHALRLLNNAQLQDRLTMLHFHIGSQITAIKRFKNALREAARVYAKISKMGFDPTYLNIGGGVGVDYDGSHTCGQSSANYSLQEFANDAVYVIGEVCQHEGVTCPDIVTESGRVIAAYHAVIVTDIREVQGDEGLKDQEDGENQEGNKDSVILHKSVREIKYILDHITSKNYIEYYHDAVEHHEDLFTLFNLGYINLNERAIAEAYFHKICLQSLLFASQQKHPPDEFARLQNLKKVKYLANFSIFQSIPDAWSIDQLFPVIPLSRHEERPTHKATIVDITCDSDGCLDRFVDRSSEKSALDLHPPNGQPYYLGFFLVGAYQESLANEHNLFGAINEVEVLMDPDGSWHICKSTEGDSIAELLTCRNYELTEMIGNYREQLKLCQAKELLDASEAQSILASLSGYLSAYPYLQEQKNT